LFAYLAQESKTKIKFIVFSFMSIAILVLFAGLRDISVGTDTEHYYSNLWREASLHRSIWSFMKSYYIHYRSGEYLYAFILVVSQKLTGNFHIFLTITHLIIIVGVYIGIYRLKEYCSPAFFMFLFCMFYYNHSLNVFRQYMAMAVLFAFSADLLERRFLRYLAAVFVAITLHNSAVLGIIPLFLYLLIYPGKRVKALSVDKRFMLYLLIVVAAILLRPIARTVINAGFANNKYESYLESEGSNTYLVPRLLSLIEVAAILFFLRSFRNYKPTSDFFFACAFTFFVLYQTASTISYGRRIPIYVAFLNLTSLGLLTRSLKLRSNAAIVQGAISLIAVVYWFLMYGYYNTSRTIPYILGV